MDKRVPTERDNCSKLIAPAIQKAGWDLQTHISKEKALTDGPTIVRGRLVARGKQKRAYYVLYLKPNIPITVVEVKGNKHAIGEGMQQALIYAKMLRVPFAFSSNGDGFVFRNKTRLPAVMETQIVLDKFPSPEVLLRRHEAWKGMSKTRAIIPFHI
ncbi:hypothetical protein [Ruegeria profundi]|uniref:Type I restriction enzyme R protein N-terminal domain-containing protein n=1 Tax=Ruegeria profundi TaxID=1685378 RepID=A0A0X3TN34_9RHOB|nr:hypothetical protein [Ruegeria profundi]KUJ77079.1 hypothetical protein AVO44_18720 [Ruegeria profundi]